MKRLFRSALAAAALALAATGALPAAAQTPPNVLIVGQIAEPQSLDPHTVTASNDFRILVNVYDGLVRYKDGTLEVEPALRQLRVPTLVAWGADDISFPRLGHTGCGRPSPA